MKKATCLLLSIIMIFTLNIPALAAEQSNVKSIEVSLDEVMKVNPKTSTSLLSKDTARLIDKTGPINSIGQYVDLTQVLPSNAKVVSITLYCPMDVKVSKGKYTFIDNYTISNGERETSVKFWRTNNPASDSKTTYFQDQDASAKWYIQLHGTVLQNYTGMDGFSVYGGKMIIEYES